MPDQSLRILLSAELNKGKAIGDLNKSIRQISKSSSLQKLNLKINIDNKILTAIGNLNHSFNNLTKSIGSISNIERQMGTASNQATQQMKAETAAVNAQNEAYAKNKTLKTKITTGNDGSIRTDATTGTKFDSTTVSQTVKGKDIINHPTVQNINEAAYSEAEKNLARFTNNSNARIKELRKSIGSLNPELLKLSKQLKGLDVSSGSTLRANITDKIKSLENGVNAYAKIQEENNKLANQMRDGAIKAQEQFQKSEKVKQQALVNTAHKQADLMNKQFDMAKSHSRNMNMIEAQAHIENMKRNKVLGDTRITDQRLAQQLAIKENEVFNKNILANTKNYADWWGKALSQRDQKEAQSTQRKQIRDQKTAQSESDRWNRNLLNREVAEKRFYDSQTQRANKASQSTSSLGSQKAADVLTRQYDKVIAKMQQMQSTGQILTQKDVEGINRRISRLSALQAAQSKLEIKTRQLTAEQQKAEVAVMNLTRRYGDKINTQSLNNLLSRIQQISPKSRTALQDARNLRNEIDKLGASAKTSASHSLKFGEALKTAFTKFPINIPGGSKTSLIAGTSLEPIKLQRKDEICLIVNAA